MPLCTKSLQLRAVMMWNLGCTLKCLKYTMDEFSSEWSIIFVSDMFYAKPF